MAVVQADTLVQQEHEGGFVVVFDGFLNDTFGRPQVRACGDELW